MTYISKQRSTLSDINRSMQSCSSAISCMSLSSPWPMLSHSSSESESTSAMVIVLRRASGAERWVQVVPKPLGGERVAK